jgi:ribosomal protein S27E
MRDKKLKFLEQGTKVEAEIVNGDCPNCKCHTVLVSIYETIFRCMTCGYDLEQKVNGKISYIPHSASKDNIKLGSPHGQD